MILVSDRLERLIADLRDAADHSDDPAVQFSLRLFAERARLALGAAVLLEADLAIAQMPAPRVVRLNPALTVVEGGAA